MFQTIDTWESKNSPLLGELFNRPGMRQFHCMEMALNAPLFHVDLGRKIEGDHEWSRYLVTEFDHVLQFLELSEKFTVRVSLQGRRNDEKAYEIVPISEILEEYDVTGDFLGYMFITPSGQRISDFRWCGDAEEYVHANRIWVAPNGS